MYGQLASIGQILKKRDKLFKLRNHDNKYTGFPIWKYWIDPQFPHLVKGIV